MRSKAASGGITDIERIRCGVCGGDESAEGGGVRRGARVGSGGDRKCALFQVRNDKKVRALGVKLFHKSKHEKKKRGVAVAASAFSN